MSKYYWIENKEIFRLQEPPDPPKELPQPPDGPPDPPEGYI
jgi:hypothetical protein